VANLSLDPQQKSRRRAGPIIIGILFFLAACGISLDFLAEQFGARRVVDEVAVVPTNSKTGGALPGTRSTEGSSLSQDAAVDSVSSSKAESSSGERAVAGQADPFVDDMSMIGPESPIGRSGSSLPSVDPWPMDNRRNRKQGASKDSGGDPADEPFEMARGQKRAPAEFEYEEAPEDLKISTEKSKWKGAPQLLPSPMYVSQLSDKRSLDIRGEGWVVIDVSNSQIKKVELFKSKAKAVNERRVIEAKYVDGSAVLNPSSSGFAIVRGIPNLEPGGFEVFENPPCLVRFSNASDEEFCDVTVRGNRARFKFSPPIVPAEGPQPDFIFTDVFFEVGRGNWKKIISFNESFQPIGDPNRDGYPDFLVESVTGYDESGVHVLLISQVQNETVEYVPYLARFKGH
jgi:hypothetical protein